MRGFPVRGHPGMLADTGPTLVLPIRGDPFRLIYYRLVNEEYVSEGSPEDRDDLARCHEAVLNWLRRQRPMRKHLARRARKETT